MRRVVYASTLLAALAGFAAAFGEAEARGPECVRTAKGKVTCGAAVGGKAASSRKDIRRPVAEPDDRRGARNAEDEAFLDALVRHRDALKQGGGQLPADEPIDLRETPRRPPAPAATTREARPPAPPADAPLSIATRPSAVVPPPPAPPRRPPVAEAPATARHIVFADPGRPPPDRTASRRPPSIDASEEIGRDLAARARAASHPETPPGDTGRLAAGVAGTPPRAQAYPDSRPYADDARQKDPGGPAGKDGQAPPEGGGARAPQ